MSVATTGIGPPSKSPPVAREAAMVTVEARRKLQRTSFALNGRADRLLNVPKEGA